MKSHDADHRNRLHLLRSLSERRYSIYTEAIVILGNGGSARDMVLVVGGMNDSPHLQKGAMTHSLYRSQFRVATGHKPHNTPQGRRGKYDE